MHKQLTLQVQLRDEATFHNFFPGKNEELITLLQSQLQLTQTQHTFFYLWGAHDVGKSHLLQASCHYAAEKNKSATYLSLADKVLTPEILDRLDAFSLICLDDLDRVIGDSVWETALFHLYNAIRDNQRFLLVSAKISPRQLQCFLPDLQSRLTWGMVYQLHGLSDAEKLLALQRRAKERGLMLSEEVATFLLRRCSRDMTSLYQILNTLDQASLQSKRPLSIPFIKSVLGI